MHAGRPLSLMVKVSGLISSAEIVTSKLSQPLPKASLNNFTHSLYGFAAVNDIDPTFHMYGAHRKRIVAVALSRDRFDTSSRQLATV